MNNGMGGMSMTGMNMGNMGMNNGMGGMGMNNGMGGMGMNNGMGGMVMTGMNMGNMGMMDQFNQMQAMQQQILNSQGNNSQFQSNVGSNNPNQSISNSDNFINIKFRKNEMGGDREIVVQCTLNDRVSDIIEKYRSKSGDPDQTKKFIFNAKALNPTLTASEAGLSNQATIFVVTTHNVKGAY